MQVLPQLAVELAARAVVNHHELADAVERAVREERLLPGEVGTAVLDRAPEQPLEGAAERGPQVVDLLERADLVVLQR